MIGRRVVAHLRLRRVARRDSPALCRTGSGVGRHLPSAASCHSFTAPFENNHLEFNFTKDVLGHWANKEPDRTAVWLVGGSEDVKISYEELYKESVTFATALSQNETPERSFIILPRMIPWWLANLAASYCGMTIVPGTSMLTEKDLQFRMQECGADCIVCSPDVADRIDSVDLPIKRKILVMENGRHSNRPGWECFHSMMAAARSRPPAPCVTGKHFPMQLFFTSGTTGKPKMVPHLQYNYIRGHEITKSHWLDLHETDVFWNISNTGWAKSAWSSLYLPFLAGCTLLNEKDHKFDGHEALETLSKYPVTVLCAPPTALRAMVQGDLARHKPLALRHCISGGEPLNPEVNQAWKIYSGQPIYEGYGQTETTLVCATSRDMEVRPGSMGRPAPGYEVHVLDDNLNEVGIGEEGVLSISLKNGHPPGLFHGYYHSENQTQRAFSEDYYLTGDKVFQDKDGYIWFVGRADDVIISSGYRIGPFEVESALQEHPAVAESAVVSSPDELRGEVVKAFVVLKPSIKALVDTDAKRDVLIKELQDHVKKVTAPYKYPRRMEFIDALPKTISSKVRRFELRDQEWAKKKPSQ